MELRNFHMNCIGFKHELAQSYKKNAGVRGGKPLSWKGCLNIDLTFCMIRN